METSLFLITLYNTFIDVMVIKTVVYQWFIYYVSITSMF